MSSQVLMTDCLRRSLSVIDGISSPKFPLLLDRIALQLEEKTFKSKLFNNEEEEKLVVSLGVNKEDLSMLLESSVYIFEQAAFHMIKPILLSRQLQSFDLSQQKADDYANAWGNHAKNIFDRLRRSCPRNCELQDVSWSLNLQMASKVHAKQKVPVAMLAFHLSDNNVPKNAYAEFNHEELYQFYKNIDAIQSQLDALRKSLLNLSHDADENSEAEKDNLAMTTNSQIIPRRSAKMKRWSLSDADGWGCPVDGGLRKIPMEFVIHGPNKALEKNKAEEPVAMLPAALVDELIGVREEKIQDLENENSSIQEQYAQAKLMYSANLKIYWSLGNGSMGKLEHSHCKELRRPISAPTLHWGRRKQLASLLDTKGYGIRSWENSREDSFSQQERGARLRRYRAALPPLKNDLQVQLWIWMEEVDGMENKLLEMESERDSLRDELQHSFNESKTLESQLNCLKISEAKEKMRTLNMREELERTSKCLSECKNKFEQAMLSKDEELRNLKKSLADQAETLRYLEVTCREIKDRNEFLESDKREKDQLLMKIEILDDQLQERQTIMETLMEDAKQRAECLARAKENFRDQVERWQKEAKSIREEISRVEQERDDSLAGIKKLKMEVQELESKCSALEKVDFDKKAATPEQDLLLKDKEYLQAEVTHLTDQLALAKAQFTKEVSARVEIERKMQEMTSRTLLLEDELDRETHRSRILEKDIQTMQSALERENEHFQCILHQIKERYDQELLEERLKAKNLMEELKEERALTNKLQGTLDDELRKQQDLERERNYDLLLQEKVNLEGKVASETSTRKDLEMKLNVLKNDLSSEQTVLQKTKEMLDDEIAKNEEVHKLLSESMSEVLKKERMIKSLKGDLIDKEKIELQLKLTNEWLQSRNHNSEDLLDEYETEKARCEELTKTCNDLMNRLTVAEKHSESIEKTYLIDRHGLEMKVTDLTEQIWSGNLRANREATLMQILKRRILELEEDLEKETSSFREKVVLLEGENAKLKAELHNFLCKQELHEENLRVMEKTRQDKINSLEERNAELREELQISQRKQELHEENSRKMEQSCQVKMSSLDERNAKLQGELQILLLKEELHEENTRAMEQKHEHVIERLTDELEDERRHRLKAEGKVEEYSKEMTKLEQEHEEALRQLREDFDRKQEEAEGLHATKDRQLREQEEELLKERKRLAGDFEFLSNQEACGDGIRMQLPPTLDQEQAKRAEARLQGVQSYYQRVLDKVSYRSAAQEAAIKWAAQSEVARARKEVALLRCQLEAERCAREQLVEVTPEAEVPGNAEGTSEAGGNAEPRIEVEGNGDGMASRSPHREQVAGERLPSENQEVPHETTGSDQNQCTNIKKRLSGELKITSRKNQSEMSIGMTTKIDRPQVLKRGNRGANSPRNYIRSMTLSSIGKGNTPRCNTLAKDCTADIPTKDGISRNIREDIRGTKSDGRFKLSEKEKYHSCKQNLETNMLRYYNHVKSNFKIVENPRVVEKRDRANGRKGSAVIITDKSITTNRVLKSEAQPSWERSSYHLKCGQGFKPLKGSIPPSDGPRMKSISRIKERVKPVVQKQKTNGNYITSP